MTTVTYPSSSPTPIYNKSGVTIVELTPGVSSSLAVNIVHLSGHTVVSVLPTTASVGWLVLPEAEVGDVVEIYPAFSGPVDIKTLGSSVSINTAYTETAGHGFFRLLTSSNWGVIWSDAH